MARIPDWYTGVADHIHMELRVECWRTEDEAACWTSNVRWG